MAKPGDIAAVRELALADPKFKRIAIVVDALLLWANPLVRDQIRVHGRQFGIDVLDFLSSLPTILGYASVEEFICGYQPQGDSMGESETVAIERWNELCRKAVALAKKPADSDWLELGEPVRILFEDLAEFVGDRYRLSQFMKEARASRTK